MSSVCTFFDKDTGLIFGHGVVGDDTVEGYFRDGTPGVRLEVAGDPTTQYIDIETLELLDYSPEELASRAAMRTGWHWQMPDRIAVDQRTIEQVRAQAWERIKAQRDMAEVANFTCGGKVYDGDAKSTGRITGAVSLATVAAFLGQPFTKTWTLADNSKVVLDGPAMMAVGVALGSRVGLAFDAAGLLRDEIDMSHDRAALDSMNLLLT